MLARAGIALFLDMLPKQNRENKPAPVLPVSTNHLTAQIFTGFFVFAEA